MGPRGHAPVVVAVQFEDLRARMADFLRHAPEEGVLFVPAQQLALPIGRDEQHGGRIWSHVVHGGHFVHDGLRARDSATASG
ncbi:MAG: hypothetical protein ACI80V_000915 [Rhodothermales bacterium]|jgi:hypothetical protein